MIRLGVLSDTWAVYLPLAASVMAVFLFWRPISRLGLRSLTIAWQTVLAPPDRLSPSTQRDRSLELPLSGTAPGRRLKYQRPVEPIPEEVFQASKGLHLDRREFLEKVIVVVAIAGDLIVTVSGFFFADLLFQDGPITSRLAKIVVAFGVADSYKLVVSGSAMVLWGLTGRNLYKYKCLLQPSRIWHKLVAAFSFCVLAFLCFSLMLRPLPPFPWLFYPSAALIVFVFLYCWRVALGWVLRHTHFVTPLRRRLVVIGGGLQTRKIQKALADSCDLEFVGWVQANKPNSEPELEGSRLGLLHELENILHHHSVDVAVLTESEILQREGVLAVARACENAYAQFKMVPHFFEILISGLRPENIGGIQLIGVEDLPLDGCRSRIAKRTVDIIGALVGLALAVPLTIFFGVLVYRESPGPILYKQLRVGRHGRCFHILKIRSMRMDAEAQGKPQWAQLNDQRRLRIGAFMRRWNIDEVPQFWNVLTGAMSLVGPRPERPELIVRFKSKIPHYQARHIYRPGMTGWAQVNGWRGNTDLEERIRHDIWYLENWSVWLDFRIMLRTFYCRKNAC